MKVAEAERRHVAVVGEPEGVLDMEVDAQRRERSDAFEEVEAEPLCGEEEVAEIQADADRGMADGFDLRSKLLRPDRVGSARVWPSTTTARKRAVVGGGVLVRFGYAGRTPSVTLTVFELPLRVTSTLTTSDGL
jgi:hypothetical protein